jgi:hypothetical protein
MTNKELQAELKKFPKDAIVYIDHIDYQPLLLESIEKVKDVDKKNLIYDTSKNIILLKSED